ncbi:MAG: hypothetical protein ACRD0P_02040 [Stackebrandtia sp.]
MASEADLNNAVADLITAAEKRIRRERVERFTEEFDTFLYPKPEDFDGAISELEALVGRFEIAESLRDNFKGLKETYARGRDEATRIATDATAAFESLDGVSTDEVEDNLHEALKQAREGVENGEDRVSNAMHATYAGVSERLGCDVGNPIALPVPGPPMATRVRDRCRFGFSARPSRR